ncbi:hypothetical protein B0H13DRAFT_1470584, partial [Mycena leptocephala]
EAPSKPVTVNWRDIRATIHGKPAEQKFINTENAGADSEEILHPVDPVHDGLDWLNDGLPDLRSTTTQHFNLEAEFNIQQYLHILADSI